MKILTVIGLFFSFVFGGLKYAFVPTVVFDAAAPGTAVSSRASGYLYGLAEENVPDSLMVQSLDVSSVSQKVIGGLQHPIGDVDHVAGNLDSCDYIVVYLQDAYDTWYYDADAIFEARRAGTYNWERFLETDFFPKVREKVTALEQTDYADRLVYCLFNECDNGVWFGTWMEEGQYAAFDDAGRSNFFEAWKRTYQLVRSIAPDALIGGPGYCDYSAEKEAWFLNYCAQNDCLPDVMIWHELGELSSEQMDLHVENYRILEEISDVTPLPIIITEYGMMEECGNPARMFRYIRQIEETGVWGNIAYWRLSDNLNDNCADGVSPNACWWLYRWYADMEGTRMEKEVQDLFHADFKNALRDRRALRHKHLNGIGCLNGTKDRVDVLLGGADYKAQVKIKGLWQTNLYKRVRVTVESVTFEGLGGKVFAPTLVASYDARAFFGTLTVKLPKLDPDSVYHITVVPAAEKTDAYENNMPPARFEFERGALLGTAYTYDSAYATTGETAGMVGGMEHPGDGVRLLFTVPDTGNYDLTLVYGKANDGASPADRVSATANCAIDGKPLTLTLQNTIRSEYTTSLTLTAWLEKGDHTIELTHQNGTFVLDSLLVKENRIPQEIAVLCEKEACDGNQTGYLAVAPENGWYTVSTNTALLGVNGRDCTGTDVFLRQGLNLLRVEGTGTCSVSVGKNEYTLTRIGAAKFDVSDGAEITGGALTGITSEGGRATFAVDAPEAGGYAVTVTYSNNEENGLHAYNVDLIETYLTVDVDGSRQNVWFRNTYSDENKATVTFTVELKRGRNTFTLTNDGSVRFNGLPNVCPKVYGVEVNPVCHE